MQLITLETRKATATVSPYGAQVMSYIPYKGEEVLWRTSDDYLEAALANGKALRGGIPLCWPWFLAHPSMAEAPSHGVGRIMQWQFKEHAKGPDTNTLTLTCTLDGTDTAWPYKTTGLLTVTLTDTLTVSLTTTNHSQTPFKLTQALHTYLNVGDIAQTTVADLTGLTRRHVTSGTPLHRHSGPFSIEDEVEHLVSPVKTLNVADTAHNRTITVTNTGSTEMVIWNPGPAKAAKLDMPEGSYRNMLCLEAATIDTAPTLQPDHSYTLTTTISVS